MRKYLSTIHTRSHGHKKRFALLVSGGFTFVVFLAWFLIRFGVGGTQVAALPGALEDTKVAVLEPDTVVTPFETVQGSFSQLVGAIKNGFDQTKAAIQNINSSDGN